MAEDKKAYEEYAEAKIKEIDARMQELQAKAEQTKAEARMDYQKELEEAQQKKKELQQKLDALRNAGEDAWQSLKTGLDAALSDMKIAVDSALRKLDKARK